MEYIAEIISALSSIGVAVLSYILAYVKMEKWKRDQDEEDKKRYDNLNRIATEIYGELHRVMHKIKADRIYILQPHPLTNAVFVSIRFEINKPGLANIRDRYQNYSMSNIPKFMSMLGESKKPFIFYNDLNEFSKIDKVACSIFRNHGAEKFAVSQLNNNSDWVGSLIVEWLDDVDLTEKIQLMRSELNIASETIQYMLPPVELSKYGDSD